MKRIGYIFEKKCDVCGKIIFPTPQWVYKRVEPNSKKKYYCSYSCYKKGEWDENIFGI